MLRSTLDVELKFDAHQKMIWLYPIGTSLIGALQRRRFSFRSKNPHQPTLSIFYIKREEFPIVISWAVVSFLKCLNGIIHHQ